MCAKGSTQARLLTRRKTLMILLIFLIYSGAVEAVSFSLRQSAPRQRPRKVDGLVVFGKTGA